MPSSVIALRADKPLTPAMVSAVWEIAAALDEQRIPAAIPNAVWLEVPTGRLRGDGARTDNVWLRECLERLTGVKLSGEFRGDPWGAVVLAEWHIVQGGSLARLLIPPAGVHALRSPANFAKIEEHAAHRLTGHARRLYAILADKKRLGRPSWSFPVAELRAALGVESRKSYERFNAFRQWVLDPAVEAINDYGTVAVRMTPEKLGRSVRSVRFDWVWKDPHDAAETASENERHRAARRRAQSSDDAPPLIGQAAAKAAAVDPVEWWQSLPDAERETLADRVGRTFRAGGREFQRREADLAAAALELVSGAARQASESHA